MKPSEFVTAFLSYAKQTEEKTGISAIAILTQAALESGWGRAAPGNMFFGVKDTDGVNGNEQLIVTTEYSRRADLKFPEVISVTPVVRNGQKFFKYIVKDYFRKYDTPEQSFTDHTLFFLKNPRYKNAVAVGSDCDKFFDAIAAAGYATAPDYAATLKAVANTIKQAIAQTNPAALTTSTSQEATAPLTVTTPTPPATDIPVEDEITTRPVTIPPPF